MDRLLEKQVSGSEKDYRRTVRALVYGSWRGEYDAFTFIDTMVGAIERNITVAWFEGMKRCGIAPEEMTEEERNAMQDFKANQYAYLIGYANSIASDSKANKGKLTPLLRRAELWVNRFGEARALAQQLACGDRKARWVMSPLKEHCVDCIKLNGRVHRLSTWRRYDIHPRHILLACGGHQCGCDWEMTDDHVTPGRPPMIG